MSRHLRVGLAGCWLAGLACVTNAQGEGGSSLSLNGSYTGDLRRNTTGGMAVGSAYAQSLDLGLTWISDGLLPGASMTTNLSVMYLAGRGISERYVGDLQGVNNLEAPQGWRLYESWVEFSFGQAGSRGSSPSLRAGVLDLNAEFDTPVTQGLFTSSPFGIGTEFAQTGVNGPVSWPTTGLGIRVAGEVTGGLRWRVGAYDGAPGRNDDDFTSTHVSRGEGALLAAELEYSTERLHKLALGAWSYTAAFDRVDAELTGAATARGNHGFYAVIDARLGAAGPVDFDGALRAGQARARFNAVDRYVGAAVTAAHFMTSRPDDTVGLGIAWARLGDDFRALRALQGQPGADETIVELVYQAPLTPWLCLLPNLQFVADPGADPSRDDAWVIGLRFEVTRERAWPLSARRPAAPAAETYAGTP